MDDSDIRNDPDFQAWERDVMENLVPALEDSALTMSLLPSSTRPDAKYAVELGMSILLDKPIMLVAQEGQFVPPKLAAIADEIIWVDYEQPDEVRARINAAAERFLSD